MHALARSWSISFVRPSLHAHSVQDRAENRVTLHTSCTPFVLEWKQIEGGSSWVLFRTTPPPRRLTPPIRRAPTASSSSNTPIQTRKSYTRSSREWGSHRLHA